MRYMINDLEFIHDHFNDKLGRIFITGAGSWLGSWVAGFLYYSGVDFEQFKYPYDKFPDGEFDHVINFAQCPIEPIIEFSQRAKAKFLFISSGSVFNPDPDAKSNKLQQERLVWSSDLDYRIARCYSFIGAGSPLRYAAARYIHDAMNGTPLEVLNNGTSIRSYLYTADMVAWLLTILIKGQQMIYDVAGTESITIWGLAKLVNKITGNSGIVIPLEVNKDIRPVYLPDPKHLDNSLELGLKQWTSIEESIIKTVKYYE
jgi:nucleoside-diphosphate-sugar epimerase